MSAMSIMVAAIHGAAAMLSAVCSHHIWSMLDLLLQTYTTACAVFWSGRQTQYCYQWGKWPESPGTVDDLPIGGGIYSVGFFKL